MRRHSKGRTDMTKLVVTFRNFVNAPKIKRAWNVRPRSGSVASTTRRASLRYLDTIQLLQFLGTLWVLTSLRTSEKSESDETLLILDNDRDLKWKWMYKVVQIWPGQTVTCLHTNSPGHIWTTLYKRGRSWVNSNWQLPMLSALEWVTN